MGTHTISVFAFLRRCPHWQDKIAEEWRDSLELPLTFAPPDLNTTQVAISQISHSASPRAVPSGNGGGERKGSVVSTSSTGETAATGSTTRSSLSASIGSARGGSGGGSGGVQPPSPPDDHKHAHTSVSFTSPLLTVDVLRIVLTFLPFPEVCQTAAVAKTFEKTIRNESKAFWRQFSAAQFGRERAVDDKERVKEMHFTQGGRFVLFDEFDGLVFPSPSVRVVELANANATANTNTASVSPPQSPTTQAASSSGFFSFLPWNKPTAAAESKESKHVETQSPISAARRASLITQAHSHARTQGKNGRSLFLRDLASRSFQRRFREVAGVQFVKIVLVGSERVGKTALVSAWAFDRVAAHYTPTVYDVAAKRITGLHES